MSATIEAVKSLETLLEALQPNEVELVVDSLKKLERGTIASPQDNLIESLVNHSYSQREKIQLELETLFRYFERRKQLLQDSLTAAEVARLLGTSRQTPHDRLKSKTLLGILDRGIYRFPTIQFDPEAPDGVIDGLPEVLKAMEVSDFAKLSWLVRPNPFLDGLTPILALKQGLKERTILEASGVGIR